MTDFITSPQGRRLAYNKIDGNPALPGVIFMSGFMSDMEGSKALALESLCAVRGQSYLRFDYSGHGQSEGAFIEGTIGKWAEDAFAIVEVLSEGPQIFVGSSMGGWIALLTARQLYRQTRTERVQGIIGIAPAPDFVTEMYDSRMTDQMRAEIQNDGVTYLPSDYDAPYPITRDLIEDGAKHCLLNETLEITCPVRILQGTDDALVPADKPERIKAVLASTDVKITMIDGGDHSLSRPEDIVLIDQAIQELS